MSFSIIDPKGFGTIFSLIPHFQTFFLIMPRTLEVGRRPPKNRKPSRKPYQGAKWHCLCKRWTKKFEGILGHTIAQGVPYPNGVTDWFFLEVSNWVLAPVAPPPPGGWPGLSDSCHSCVEGARIFWGVGQNSIDFQPFFFPAEWPESPINKNTLRFFYQRERVEEGKRLPYFADA